MQRKKKKEARTSLISLLNRGQLDRKLVEGLPEKQFQVLSFLAEEPGQKVRTYSLHGYYLDYLRKKNLKNPGITQAALRGRFRSLIEKDLVSPLFEGYRVNTKKQQEDAKAVKEGRERRQKLEKKAKGWLHHVRQSGPDHLQLELAPVITPRLTKDARVLAFVEDFKKLCKKYNFKK